MKTEPQTREIKLHLESVENGYSQYSSDENVIIHKNLYYYVEETALDYNLKDKLSLNVNVAQKINDEEKSIFANSFKKHYQQEIIYKEKDIKKDDIVAVIMLAIGVGLIALLWLFETIHLNFIIKTTFEIIAWVFMWEFVDTFFFKRTKDKAEILFYKRLMNAKIIFTEAKHKKNYIPKEYNYEQ